jgi:hypothetical protein
VTPEEITKRVTKIIGDEFARASPADRQEVLSTFATTALVLLHGTYGRQWIMDYLRGATEDLSRENCLRVEIVAPTQQ